MSTPTTPTESSTPPSTTSSLLRRLPTQKITSFIRLKTQRPEKHPPIIFPPPSWSLDETQNNGAGASDLPDEPHIPRNISEDNVTKEDVPEPSAFAQRIRTLIDSLPLPAPTKDADVGAVDPKGPPLPLSVTADSKLVKLLSSESVMNGSLALGRQSVWSMLERLKPGKSAAPGDTKTGGDSDKGDEREDEGVMMYAPLQPDANSQVELADSETVLEYLDEPEPGKVDPTAPAPEPPAGKSDGGLKPSKSRRKRKVAEEHIHWVPSPTKISLQAMWWGYRLYLPPPVMKVLNNTHLEAAKRGAMITAALKYILDKVPLLLLPPQIRPAMMALKRLTPYLGYVGVFIAWSWTAIKARDKGEGVVLTATWLLPVALVPGTLKAEDFKRAGGTKGDKPSASSSEATSGSASETSDPNTGIEPCLKPDAAQTAPSPTADIDSAPPRRWPSFLKRETNLKKADKEKGE